jgi:phage tail-like protein
VASDRSGDPIPAFNFEVELIACNGESGRVAGFSECSGLESTLDVEEYKEGGVNDRIHKFRSRFHFANIVLKRGVTLDGDGKTLRDWHSSLMKGSSEYRNGSIYLLNERGERVLAWEFERGLPVKYSGPALNATQSQAAIETLEISHERLKPFDPGRR